ncbi:MAG TPA: hypothetical protein VEF04_03025 [Blastocatellia bacterium]|nr:hypothetical protein [Blastocatellia bacterium]
MMKVQLKKDAPDKVEVALGPQVYIFERSKGPTEVRDRDWPVLEKMEVFEPFTEEPIAIPTPAETEEATPEVTKAEPVKTEKKSKQ